MPNEFPISPEVLAEASPYSLNDLALMSPEEMNPAAELAYIAELRAYRERYERALGLGATRSLKGRPSGTKPSLTAKVILDGGVSPNSDVEF